MLDGRKDEMLNRFPNDWASIARLIDTGGRCLMPNSRRRDVGQGQRLSGLSTPLAKTTIYRDSCTVPEAVGSQTTRMALSCHGPWRRTRLHAVQILRHSSADPINSNPPRDNRPDVASADHPGIHRRRSANTPQADEIFHRSAAAVALSAGLAIRGAISRGRLRYRGAKIPMP